MVRGFVGFAGFFILFMLGMKVIGFLIGGLIGLVLKLVWFAFLGWMISTIIRVLSPSTADRIWETVRGKPSES
ncbi:MAG: hypothetical protein EXR94_12610 [Gemmatimonadetes bacterium]|nr:hypothetical protein [Gemmatimonadota bacterium]